MQLRVVGYDPSLTHWGVARALLDLDSGHLSDFEFDVIVTAKTTIKQTRTNTDDINRSQTLFAGALDHSRWAQVSFAEVPVGSQNASGMKSYAVCCGLLGALGHLGMAPIQVNPFDVKKTFTGNANASKQKMIDTALELYPDAPWPRHVSNGSKHKKGDLRGDVEHIVDAVAAIHAGANTSEFRQLMALYKK